MNTLAISVRSAVRFFACGLSESRETSVRDTPFVAVANRGSRRRRVVAIGAETARFFRCLFFRLGRRAPRGTPRTHRLRGRHLLRLGLSLHRAQGLLEPVRLEVRLDGRDEVGGVGTHRNCRWATASRRNGGVSRRRNLGGGFVKRGRTKKRFFVLGFCSPHYCTRI